MTIDMLDYMNIDACRYKSTKTNDCFRITMQNGYFHQFSSEEDEDEYDPWFILKKKGEKKGKKNYIFGESGGN